MINTSNGYKEAVKDYTRRTRLRVALRLVSPDLVYGAVTSTGEAAVSRPAEIHNETTEGAANYATLEANRWALDGTVPILEDDYSTTGQVGFVGDALSGADGAFSPAQSVTLGISGVSALQAVCVSFSDQPDDGVPEDYTLEVLNGDTAFYTETVTGNTATSLVLFGFTVYTPTAIRVTVTKWSLPYRRMRVLEIYPGYLTTWTQKNVTAAAVQMQAAISGLQLPYGTATLTIDNTDRMFDPRNKSGLFQSLEERQAVPLELGIDLEDGTTEYLPVGTYYQHDNGWKTADSGMTMRWSLVDIIGLLSGRSFVAPTTLPTTLSAWVEELVGQLGDSFRTLYTVDESVASQSVTASTADVDGQNCGDILRWLCQISGTFARADAETGYLAVEPLWSQGNEQTLADLTDIPVLLANENVGSIIFKVGSSEMVVSGNTSTSANTVNVSNPFIKTEAAALTAAQNILSSYGGNKITTNGRGDPSSEIGDVVTVQLDKANAATGRLLSQSFDYSGGVLRNCKSELLQSNGAELYENREVITESGTWTAPAGVTALTVILIGGGQAGGKGHWGTTAPDDLFSMHEGWNYGNYGAAGDTGTGGLVWYATIPINDGQSFNVSIGSGGTYRGTTATVDGEPTTFGAYSSANGRVYNPAFTDIASGSAYARTGVEAPAEHSGDGGKGGYGGGPGRTLIVPSDTGGLRWDEVQSGYPPGDGTSGGSGCVIVYWDKEDS